MDGVWLIISGMTFFRSKWYFFKVFYEKITTLRGEVETTTGALNFNELLTIAVL